jgi:hypothetical protein
MIAPHVINAIDGQLANRPVLALHPGNWQNSANVRTCVDFIVRRPYCY